MDLDGQLTFEDDPNASRMKIAINQLRLGEFAEASQAFNELFETDPDYPGVMTGIRAAEFWKNRADQIASMELGLEKGKFLKKEWNRFEEFIQNHDEYNKLHIQAVRIYIFTEAIHSFTRAYQNTISPDISLIYDIGECYFNIRDFEKAVETFEYAWEFKRDNSKLLARLADAYFALSDSPEIHKKSRLLFREAFLYNPEEIELDRIKADFIETLITTVREKGFIEEEVPLWLPIYAAIEHEFNVKRELEEHEVNTLSDQIYRLEQDLIKAGTNTKLILPSLLNRYLWLIDHFYIEERDSIKVEMLKKKFQDADSEIYKMIFYP